MSQPASVSASEHELAGAAHAALAHDEHARAGDGLLAPEAKDVDVLGSGEHDALLVVKAVYDLQAALDARGALEVQLGGGVCHLGLELGDELAAVPRQEVLHGTDVLGVLLGGDAAGAHTGATTHVVVEARTAVLGLGERHDVGLLGVGLKLAADALPLGAGGQAHRHDLAHHVNRGAGGAGVRVGAKVARARPVALARVLDGREDVILGDGDVGVALVVLEVDVEGRSVLVDEVDLQHEGLVLRPHHHVVEAGRGRHEARHHGALIGELHVLAQPRAQVLGLAHVQDVALGILPQVAARVDGGGGHLLGDRGRVRRAVARLGGGAGVEVRQGAGELGVVRDGLLPGGRRRLQRGAIRGGLVRLGHRRSPTGGSCPPGRHPPRCGACGRPAPSP